MHVIDYIAIGFLIASLLLAAARFQTAFSFRPIKCKMKQQNSAAND